MVFRGSSKHIRLPMYTSVLLITLAWVLNYFTIFRFTVWIALVIDLWLKLRYEEKLLAIRYKEYQDYRKETKKLIPFIF